MDWNTDHMPDLLEVASCIHQKIREQAAGDHRGLAVDAGHIPTQVNMVHIGSLLMD